MKPRNHPSRTRSQAAYREALLHFPGGVNSPVRSWRSVGLANEGPFFVAAAKGAELVDLDGRRLTNPQSAIAVKSGAVLKVGKRQFLKILF